nr:MAG TPA: hypothetical protein [Caudoviricetes sp.]
MYLLHLTCLFIVLYTVIYTVCKRCKDDYYRDKNRKVEI